MAPIGSPSKVDDDVLNKLKEFLDNHRDKNAKFAKVGEFDNVGVGGVPHRVFALMAHSWRCLPFYHRTIRLLAIWSNITQVRAGPEFPTLNVPGGGPNHKQSGRSFRFCKPVVRK